MALLKILEYPDPRLRTKAKVISDFGDSLQSKIDDMFETMYAAPGIGLAATQIDFHEQVFVLDVSENKDEPLVFINPEIIELNGVEEMEEGCLSFPGVYATVKRADSLKVIALDRLGKTFEMEADELLAVCIQHELDHLKGKLFVDYLSALKRQRIRKKLEKELKSKSSTSM